MQTSKDTWLVLALREAARASESERLVLMNKPQVQRDPDGIRRGKPGKETIFGAIHKFKSRVEVRGADDCWLWSGRITTRGYGDFTYLCQHIRAHRFAFMLDTLRDPTGLLVCHKCDTPRCCNPAHLFLGTDKDNVADMIAKGRRRVYQGEDHHASKVNALIVREIRASDRPNQELAAHYGVSGETIGLIRRRKTWVHVADAA